MLNSGKSYLRHLGNDRVRAALANNKFRCFSEFSSVNDCQAVIICVPTPLDRHLQPDLSFVENTVRGIANYIQVGTLVSLESTTWPGTTLEVVRPLLESGSGNLRVGESLFLCFSPEREDPGNKSYTTKSIPKLVGADDPRSMELAVALYRAAIDTVIPVSGTRVAEMAKLYENIFRGVNIALANEMKVILDRMNIDVWEVIRAASSKPFGFMPFYPGPGLGGHCIPLDPFYFSWKAKEYGFNARFIELAGEINRGMPQYVVGKVQECLNDRGKSIRGCRILVIGLAYKPDVDDLRESPSLVLIDLLERRGAAVNYHDPYISVIHSTREHAQVAGRTSRAISPDYDCFVLATHHQCLDASEILSHGVPVIDTRHFFSDHPLVTRS